MQSITTQENISHEIEIRFSEIKIPNRKRKHEDYNLDERLHEQFSWNDGDLSNFNKRLKLDNLFDRREVLNSRASFTNLVSSASLILPPEVDTVVITRDKFVVEWSQGSDKIPLTQVK